MLSKNTNSASKADTSMRTPSFFFFFFSRNYPQKTERMDYVNSFHEYNGDLVLIKEAKCQSGQ